MDAYEYDHDYQRWLASCAEACSCAPCCNQSPCAGTTAGGFCDGLSCHCGRETDEHDDDFADETEDDYDEPADPGPTPNP